MQIVEHGIPRRARLDLHTPAEMAIRTAVLEVEAVGAHPLLTDAVILLSQAREKVADYEEQHGRFSAAPTEPARAIPPAAETPEP